MGFRRNYIYQSRCTGKEEKQNSSTISWLMREYSVGMISSRKTTFCSVPNQEEYKTDEGCCGQLQYGGTRCWRNNQRYVAWTLIPTAQHIKLLTRHNRIISSSTINKLRLIILMKLPWSSTTREQEAYGQIEQVQGHGTDDIIGSDGEWLILEDITIDIPDDLWQHDYHQSQLQLVKCE